MDRMIFVWRATAMHPDLHQGVAYYWAEEDDDGVDRLIRRFDRRGRMSRSAPPELVERNGRVFAWSNKDESDPALLYILHGARARPGGGHPDGPKDVAYFKIYGRRSSRVPRV